MGFSFKNLLFGKKSDQFAPSRLRTVDAERQLTGDLGQRELRGGFTRLKSYDPTVNIEASMDLDKAQRLKSLTAQQGDIKRNLQSRLASRGLGSSSIALNQERAIDSDIAKRRGEVLASAPVMKKLALEQAIRDQEDKVFSAASRLAGASRGNILFEKGSPSKRSGGLAKLGAQAVGAYFGGPMGAQMAGSGYDATAEGFS